MYNWLSLLNQDWLSLIGIFIAIVFGLFSIVLSLLIYKWSLRGPQLICQFQSVYSTEKGLSDLPNSKIRVILWNAGSDTLKGEYIVISDPPRLEFSKNTKVLNVYVRKVTRTQNEFKATVKPNAPNVVICGFDYLDRGDGATIELLHTNKKPYPEIRGTIRRMPAGILCRGHVPPFFLPRSYKLIFFIMVFLDVLMIAYGLLFPMTLNKDVVIVWSFLSESAGVPSISFLRWYVVIGV